MSTIIEVAQRAGVSTATVSRVLRQPEHVRQPTREKVMAAVRALDYAPNHAARSLRTLRSSKIIVTVPDISNIFFASVIRGAEEAAQAAGYSVLLGDTRNEEEREELYAAMLERREADGLIFLGHRLPKTLAGLIARKGAAAPIVNACEFSPELRIPSVHIDNVAAADEAMELLYSMGHRRIGVITGPMDSPISQDRLAGARAAAARREGEADLLVTTGDFSVESGEVEGRRLLADKRQPTALFCFSDEMAMGALSALRAIGLRAPEDVSIIGFDDIRLARFMDPPLTTIRQPMHAMGREAVQLLIQLLSGDEPSPVSRTLPHELVVRRSTGPRRG